MTDIKAVTGVDCNFSGALWEIPHRESDFVPGDKVIFQDEDGREEFGTIIFLNPIFLIFLQKTHLLFQCSHLNYLLPLKIYS
jgi:hypothetical protein